MAMSVSVVGMDRHVTKMFYERGFIISARPDQADILCFIDGFDVDPSLYGQKRSHRISTTSFIDDKRDLDAWKSSNPRQMKVGIQRGGHFLNAMNKGSSYQHVSGHMNMGHTIQDTLSHRPIYVSSQHHQLMVPGPNAEVLGYSEDVAHGFIGEDGTEVARPDYETEVVWYEGTKTLCYQPNPELEKYPGCTEHFFSLIGLLK